MSKSLQGLSLAACALFACAASGAERVGDFALLDQLGEHHSMRWYNDHKSIAFLVQAVGSEASLSSLPAYIELQQEYDAQGIQFFMLNPMGRLNRDAVQEEISAFTDAIPRRTAPPG